MISPYAVVQWVVWGPYTLCLPPTIHTLARFPISGILKENDISHDCLPVKCMCKSIDRVISSHYCFFFFFLVLIVNLIEDKLF